MPDDPRRDQLADWLHTVAHLDIKRLVPLAGDASFRRYFRVTANHDRYILMDAPPNKEDCRPFVDTTNRLRAAGLNVPRIVEADVDNGLLLLSDLGDTLYLSILDNTNADGLYADALTALSRIQTAETAHLPPYDAALLNREMALFRDWYLRGHLRIELTQGHQRIIEDGFQALVQTALAQPRVFVHRDFHSRNLLVTDTDNPGIIDYQDAVYGPLTYDLVSLLRDCYIAWPNQWVENLALGFRDAAVAADSLAPIGDEAFMRWFDWMGVQRHLKAIGIFARLHHRDGKSGYLADIPRTLGYVMTVTRRYRALGAFHELLHTLLPADALPQVE